MVTEIESLKEQFVEMICDSCENKTEEFKNYISKNITIEKDDNGISYIDCNFKVEDNDFYYDLCDVYKPHQGNINCHLQELAIDFVNIE